MWPAWLATGAGQALGGLGAAAANTAGAMIGGKRQYKYTKKLAAFEHAKNMEMLQYQLDYNSPLNQMQRFKDAGLNPNLVYGQGTPGNMDSPPRYPNMQPPDMTLGLSQIGSTFQRGSLMAAQHSLLNQKVEESGVKQDLMRAQAQVTRSNPYLNRRYVDAMVINLESVAKLKEQEAGFMLSKTVDQEQMPTGGKWERGYLKMQRQLDLLGQKYRLGESDQKVKGRIIESKEFENDLKEIQRDWMKDGDMTPQHIYQGILLLLSKMM